MKKILIPALLLSLLFNFASADEKKKDKPAPEKAAKVKAEAKPNADKPKADKPQPELKELTLTGKITKKETVGKNEKKYSFFYLETSDGNQIRLSQSALGKKSTIKLDDFVDANVTVRAKGFEKTLKDKKVQTYIKEIASIEK
jgi:hypothetical protein